MKHEAWRHDPAAYGQVQPVAARFADVDTRRHINNIAVHGLHHEARQRWLMAVGGSPVWPAGTLRIKPLHSRTEFWRECHYPAPLSAGLRLLAADDGGLTLAGGLFQGGACVGMQQTQLAAWDAGLATPQSLPAGLAGRLATAAQPAGALHAPHRPPGAERRGHYPVAALFAARYGDLDADGATSEAAAMRGIEQARAALLKAAFAASAAADGDTGPDWTSLLVARIDLHWVHHRAPPQQWALAAAVTHTGRSSAVLRVAMFEGQALQATADCVMVNTDPAGPGGAVPLPAPLRQALQQRGWHGDAD